MNGTASQGGGVAAKPADGIQPGASGIGHCGGRLPGRGGDALVGLRGEMAAGRQLRRADAQHRQQYNQDQLETRTLETTVPFHFATSPRNFTDAPIITEIELFSMERFILQPMPGEAYAHH